MARVEPAGVALPADRRDRPGMGEEELGLAAAAEQLVEVVRGGRAGAGVDALLEVGVVQQTELPVVDQLVLLALAQRLDGEPELLLGLVHRLVVEVGDPGVDPQDGLRDAEFVLARLQFVVDERARQRRLAGVAGGDTRSRPRPAGSAAGAGCAVACLDMGRAGLGAGRRASWKSPRERVSRVPGSRPVAVNSQRALGSGSTCSPNWSPSASTPSAVTSSPYLPTRVCLTRPWAIRYTCSAGAPPRPAPRPARTPAGRTGRRAPSAPRSSSKPRSRRQFAQLRRDHPDLGTVLTNSIRPSPTV